MEDDELLDVIEASAMLRLSPATLRNWRWKGSGPPYVRLGSRVLYRRSELLAFVERQTRTSTSDRGQHRERVPA